MKFAAWRKVLSIFLLAVFLCAVPSLLTACSRSPASGSTELLDSTQLYFIELGRLVPGFEQPMLDSFREAAEKLDACVKTHDAYFAEYPDAKAAFALMVQLPDVLEQNLGASGEDGYDQFLPAEGMPLVFLRDRSVALCVSGCLRCKIQHESSE